MELLTRVGNRRRLGKPAGIVDRSMINGWAPQINITGVNALCLDVDQCRATPTRYGGGRWRGNDAAYGRNQAAFHPLALPPPTSQMSATRRGESPH